MAALFPQPIKFESRRRRLQRFLILPLISIPVLRLLKSYKVVVLGDREFRSIRLAQWLDAQGVYFALRQKKSTYIQQPGQDYQRLNSRLISSWYEDVFNWSASHQAKRLSPV